MCREGDGVAGEKQVGKDIDGTETKTMDKQTGIRYRLHPATGFLCVIQVWNIYTLVQSSPPCALIVTLTLGVLCQSGLTMSGKYAQFSREPLFFSISPPGPRRARCDDMRKR